MDLAREFLPGFLLRQSTLLMFVVDDVYALAAGLFRDRYPENRRF